MSSSSSSIDSSSSSSIDSSSSSSSSSLVTDSKSLPFVFEVEQTTPILSIAFDNEDVYVGTGADGILLKSSDRQFWSKIYTVDDSNISALIVQNRNLFIGTTSTGKIYIRDLDTNTTALSAELGASISEFCYFQNNMYVATSNPSKIYKFNTETLKWDFIYKPYASVVTEMFSDVNKMYVFLDAEDFISFDGQHWGLEKTNIDNISSFRYVSTEPFSHNTESFINRQDIKGVEGLDNEEIYSVFPIRYAKGIRSATLDGSALVLGSSNYGRVWNYSDGNLNSIFQTESSNTVYSILNLNIGTNLVSIDNKLYLVHCGELETTTTTTTDIPTTTTTTTTAPGIVSLIFPNGGEALYLGEIITITWSSSLGVTEAMKLELYKNGEVDRVINPGTSNDGSYEWIIPADIIPGIDYKIGITWLSTGNAGSEVNLSNSDFIISGTEIEATTTTTTTTMITDSNLPDIDDCRGIPILVLPENEQILVMKKDISKGGILFGTSKGRILWTDEVIVNAYLTGDRKVYAEVQDGFGNVSDTASTSVFYALYNKIAEINSDKEVVKWKFEENASVIMTDRLAGTFLSPIINVKEDLGFWKQLLWREEKPSNTEILICIRAASTVEELKLKSWDDCFISRDSDRGYGSTGVIIRDLLDINLKGQYLQFKVVMTTDVENISPSLLDLTITYSTKFAVYFFTTKFSLQNNSDVKTGLLVANMTEPVNTKIKFGISNTNSSDWENYTVVDPNKFFELNDFENIKVGIKMISYDDNIPEVAEFALMNGSEKNNLLNS